MKKNLLFLVLLLIQKIIFAQSPASVESSVARLNQINRGGSLIPVFNLQTRKVVQFLVAQPLVAGVGYPELEGHPSHALAKALLPRGCGAVFSFDLKGSRGQGKAFIESLKIFSHLANVGDCRSLVIHPASTTHFRMDDAALAQAGIAPGTIRLSIGLEDADDLIDDLKRALKIAEKAA